jgi:hypothetical protein
MKTDLEVWSGASRKPPFASEGDGYAWMEHWCARCEYEMDCTVIVVGTSGRTPAEWVPQPGAPREQAYICTEYLAALP